MNRTSFHSVALPERYLKAHLPRSFPPHLPFFRISLTLPHPPHVPHPPGSPSPYPFLPTTTNQKCENALHPSGELEHGTVMIQGKI